MRDFSNMFNGFLNSVFEFGFEVGREREWKTMRDVCKYFRHKGGKFGSAGCSKLQNYCDSTVCPAKDEKRVSVRGSE